MSMVLTFRTGKFAALAASVAVALAGLSACSREQSDWRSAEASDTVEAYSDFLKDHPDSGLVRQARARLTQLSEDRAWSQAGSADTVDAYKQFLAQYPNGKWSQEARIRLENFELGASPAGASPGALAQAPAELTSAQTSVASAPTSSPVAPGEAAQLPTSPNDATVQSPRPSTYPVAAAAPLSSASSVTTNASGAAVSSVATAWRSADPISYGVQLGAFASENAATSQWQQLVERFNAQLRGLAPHVVSAETATGRLFRLQALVADEATARALCDMLRKQSQACVPVLPH
jgi:cell division septation protein DedD